MEKALSVVLKELGRRNGRWVDELHDLQTGRVAGGQVGDLILVEIVWVDIKEGIVRPLGSFYARDGSHLLEAKDASVPLHKGVDVGHRDSNVVETAVGGSLLH